MKIFAWYIATMLAMTAAVGGGAITHPMSEAGAMLSSSRSSASFRAETERVDETPPAWAPNIDPQMLAVIQQLDSFQIPPLQLLPPHQARKTKSPTAAVAALLQKKGTPPAPPKVGIAHQVIPGPEGTTVLVRTYTPMAGAGPFPVIVYYHGGGWVIANLDTYEPSAKALAEQANAIVVSVAYR